MQLLRLWRCQRKFELRSDMSPTQQMLNQGILIGQLLIDAIVVGLNGTLVLTRECFNRTGTATVVLVTVVEEVAIDSNLLISTQMYFLRMTFDSLQ